MIGGRRVDGAENYFIGTEMYSLEEEQNFRKSNWKIIDLNICFSKIKIGRSLVSENEGKKILNFTFTLVVLNFQ